MNGNDISSVGANLKKILSAETEMLLSGRAADAVSLIEEKMSAMRELELLLEAPNQNTVPALQRREIETIKQMAEVNAVHFETIRNGVHNAISRLESLHGSAYVGSYKPGGGKVSFPEATGRYMKKS